MAVLNDEQEMLRNAVRAWVRERAPVAAFRAMRNRRTPLGYDPAVYRDMAEMGWTGVIIPQVQGGADFGYLSLGVMLEELGRTLTASPLLSTTLAAASALVLGGTEAQQAAWLPDIASGATLATLAVDEGPRHDPAAVSLTASIDGTGWRLNGSKRPVLDGIGADLLIVAARTAPATKAADGITLFLIATGAAGLTRTALPQVDGRGAAMVGFANVVASADVVLGPLGNGGALLDAVLDRARAGLAAEMLGSATQAYETTMEYLKTRVQFGQPIGSFQALQHRAADLLGELEVTRSAVEAALLAIDAGSDAATIAELASLAKLMATETLRCVANEMVQMHGGIGMTDEHDAGLYLKRSRATAVAYGDAAFHRERFGRLSGF